MAKMAKNGPKWPKMKIVIFGPGHGRETPKMHFGTVCLIFGEKLSSWCLFLHWTNILTFGTVFLV